MSLKNTYYTILFLSVFSALVIGLNIGKRLEKAVVVTKIPTPTTVLQDASDQSALPSDTNDESTGSADFRSATGSGGLKGTPYTSTACNISLTYPDTVTVKESATETAGVIFAGKTNPNDIVILTCQKDIPVPALASGNVEETRIGTVAAKLYHDASPKDGTKTDALMFTHPKTKLDVLVGGYGPAFNFIIQTLKIL